MTSVFNSKPIKIENGISIFSEEHFYWHTNISLDQIRTLQNSLKTTPLKEAALSAGIDVNYITDYQRSDIIYFLPHKKGSDVRILDLGSGFGNITIPLAEKMPNAKVYAVDASLDILKVLKENARWEGCENIECVKVDVFEKHNLPFTEKSFDLIIMNGVLEWIGSGVAEGDPREHQISFMKYLKTLLKDDGHVYVGIEGRFFPGYFMGIKDPHSGLRFTSVVPRFISRLICRLNGLGDYRTYTYSYGGYNDLFMVAGFDHTNTRTTFPVASYKDPFFMFDYDDKYAYAYAFTEMRKKIFPTPRSQFLYRILYKFGLERFFAPSYLFVLGRSERNERRLVDKYLSEFLGNNAINYEVIKVLGNLSNNGSVSFFLVNKNIGRPEYVLKIKRLAHKNKDMGTNLSGMSQDKMPRVLLPIKSQNEAQLFAYINGAKIDNEATELKMAARLVRDFHEKNITSKITVMGLELTVGLVHGDYTSENIIRGDDGPFIIDLDDVDYNTLQIFDVCSLIMHHLRIVKRLTPEEVARSMFDHDALDVFNSYNNQMDGRHLKYVWTKYLEYEIAKNAGQRTAKEKFYLKLANILPGITEK